MNTLRKRFNGDRIGYLFVLPALVYMLSFVGYPMVNNIIMSFQDISIETFTQARKFVGLENYMELFKGSILSLTIYNTFYFTIFSVIFQFGIGFALALLFSRKFILAKSLRGFIVISWLIPVTITALLYKFMFSMDGGIINEALLYSGIINKPVEWLIQPFSAIWAIIIANIWIGVPFNMTLMATGLATIPKELYESADIDGANKFHKFFSITIPYVKPAIKAVLILGFIYTFKVFDLVYIMTGGGPVNATELLSTYSYRLSFSEFNFSRGAAVTNILFVILFIVGLGYLRLVKDEEVM